MEHDAAVANRPVRATLALLADEPIFDADHVVRELVLVKEVAELLVKRVVLVVAYLDQAVFDAKRVTEVLAKVVPGNLRRPAVEVLAVEQRFPLVLVVGEN